MPSKAQRIAGWILTGLIGLFLIGVSGVPKFIDFPNKAEMFEHLRVKLSHAPILGIVEIVITVLFLIPRTAFLGAILLTGYLGGAACTHLLAGDDWYFPIIIGVLAWIALGLRYPVIFAMAMGQLPTMSKQTK